MRFLLILNVAAFAGCGGSSDDSGNEDDAQGDMHTVAEELHESIDTAIEKAEKVEDALAEAAEDLDKAIEEASGE